LTSKIESLSRRVLSLQKKLADAKTPISVPASQDNIPAQAASTGPVSATSMRDPGFSTRGSHPIMPVSSDGTQPSNTPVNRTRAHSGPSSLPRPKTPERKPAPQYVFGSRTPESRISPPSSSSAVLIGKKRPPPDDFDALPTQGFTTDSLPAGLTTTESSTPRRRALQGHSGFTPVRHGAAQPTTSFPSPRRTAAVPRPKLIADVTNSPHRLTSAESGPKRSWLGKIRSASSQTAARAPSRTGRSSRMS
jgi:hypothetical protein